MNLNNKNKPKNKDNVKRNVFFAVGTGVATFLGLAAIGAGVKYYQPRKVQFNDVIVNKQKDDIYTLKELKDNYNELRIKTITYAFNKPVIELNDARLKKYEVLRYEYHKLGFINTLRPYYKNQIKFYNVLSDEEIDEIFNQIKALNEKVNVLNNTLEDKLSNAKVAKIINNFEEKKKYDLNLIKYQTSSNEEKLKLIEDDLKPNLELLVKISQPIIERTINENESGIPTSARAFNSAYNDLSEDDQVKQTLEANINKWEAIRSDLSEDLIDLLNKYAKPLLTTFNLEEAKKVNRLYQILELKGASLNSTGEYLTAEPITSKNNLYQMLVIYYYTYFLKKNDENNIAYYDKFFANDDSLGANRVNEYVKWSEKLPFKTFNTENLSLDNLLTKFNEMKIDSKGLYKLLNNNASDDLNYKGNFGYSNNGYGYFENRQERFRKVENYFFNKLKNFDLSNAEAQKQVEYKSLIGIKTRLNKYLVEHNKDYYGIGNFFTTEGENYKHFLGSNNSLWALESEFRDWSSTDYENRERKLPVERQVDLLLYKLLILMKLDLANRDWITNEKVKNFERELNRLKEKIDYNHFLDFEADINALYKKTDYNDMLVTIENEWITRRKYLELINDLNFLQYRLDFKDNKPSDTYDENNDKQWNNHPKVITYNVLKADKSGFDKIKLTEEQTEQFINDANDWYNANNDISLRYLMFNSDITNDELIAKYKEIYAKREAFEKTIIKKYSQSNKGRFFDRPRSTAGGVYSKYGSNENPYENYRAELSTLITVPRKIYSAFPDELKELQKQLLLQLGVNAENLVKGNDIKYSKQYGIKKDYYVDKNISFDTKKFGKSEYDTEIFYAGADINLSNPLKLFFVDKFANKNNVADKFNLLFDYNLVKLLNIPDILMKRFNFENKNELARSEYKYDTNGGYNIILGSNNLFDINKFGELFKLNIDLFNKVHYEDNFKMSYIDDTSFIYDHNVIETIKRNYYNALNRILTLGINLSSPSAFNEMLPFLFASTNEYGRTLDNNITTIKGNGLRRDVISDNSNERDKHFNTDYNDRESKLSREHALKNQDDINVKVFNKKLVNMLVDIKSLNNYNPAKFGVGNNNYNDADEYNRTIELPFEGFSEQQIQNYRNEFNTLKQNYINQNKAIDDNDKDFITKGNEKLTLTITFIRDIRAFYQRLLSEPAIEMAYQRMIKRGRIYKSFFNWNITVDKNSGYFKHKNVYNPYDTFEVYNYLREQQNQPSTNTNYWPEFLALIRKHGGRFTDRSNNQLELVQSKGLQDRKIITPEQFKMIEKFNSKVLSPNSPENTKYYNFIFKATDEEIKDIIGEELFNNDEKMTNFLLDFDDLGFRLIDTYKRMVKNYTDNNIQPLSDEEVEAINQQ